MTTKTIRRCDICHASEEQRNACTPQCPGMQETLHENWAGGHYRQQYLMICNWCLHKMAATARNRFKDKMAEVSSAISAEAAGYNPKQSRWTGD